MPRGPAGRRMPPPPPQGADPRGSRRRTRAARRRQAPRTARWRSACSRPTPRSRSTARTGADLVDQDRLVIEIAEGSHTVEIRKPGYRTYVTQVEVRRGETAPLNVSLRSEQ